jgi:hypothetical protein
MFISPNALTSVEFNKNIPDVFLKSEIIARIITFAMPAFFNIGLSSKTQKNGLILYLAGVVIYFMSYGIQNFFPNTAWSLSLIGFSASYFTNLIWIIGLGLMGQEFYAPIRLRYHAIIYIAPSTVFIILHVIHSIIYYRASV